jgi:SAM-dependent methyltransferase
MEKIDRALIKNKVNELYDQDGVWYIDNSPEYACFHKELVEYNKMVPLKNADLFLEIGAGRGRVLSEFTDRCRKFIAVDISDKMINNLKGRHLNNVYIIKADAQRLPLKERIFDLVFAPAVIGHCSDPVEVASEMKRVMRDDGTGIISTTANSLSIPGLFGQIKSFLEHKSFSRDFLLLKQGYCRDSYFLIKKALLKAGLRLKNVSGTGLLPSFLDISVRAKTLEKLCGIFPFKYFCRVIIISFKKSTSG